MKTLTITLLAVALLTIVSCTPVLYSSVGQNVPLFHEKGEVAFSGSYCEIWDAKGFSMQFATAVSSKLAVTSSFYSMNNSSYASEDTWKGNGSYFEVGAGKYHYSSEKKWTYELIGGLGYGSMRNSYASQAVNANYVKPFFQPSFGISGGIIEVALTPRIGLVNYVSHSNTMTDAYDAETVENYFDSKKTTLVFEPGATVRVGYRNVKLQAQYVYSTFDSEDDSIDPINPEFISIGLHILITNRFKK
ncbi:MAG TPA: hypothetical protein VFW11_19895 [Cyclobacteriaceae bacterium]|nr:hypothetical protein [Cyclobacteriaceae bacterium]